MRPQELETDAVRTAVREHYGKVATQARDCGCAPTCCTPAEHAPATSRTAAEVAQTLGYSVDVILSNCVINLSPDKRQVFREAFRVLKPGGRLAISDILATSLMPESVRKDLVLYAGCVAGASPIDDAKESLHAEGPGRTSWHLAVRCEVARATRTRA